MTTAKKTDPTVFPSSVCARLTNIVEGYDQTEAKRQELFEQRNAAEERRNAADLGSTERADAEREYGGLVLEIKRYNRAAKELEIAIRDTVKKARTEAEKLWPDPAVTIDEFLPAAVKKPETPTEPKQKEPVAPEVQVPEGVNQHAAASINELKLPESMRKKLLSRGYTTVASMIALRGRDGFMTEAGLDEHQAEQASHALDLYLRAHNRAQLEADRGEAAA